MLDADEWGAMGVGDDALLADLLDEAASDTDALLAELLGEEPTTSSQELTETLRSLPSSTADETPSDSSTGDRPKAGRVVRKTKTKHTVDYLRHEVSHLTSELKRLRSECNIPEPHVRTAMEAATAERLKRRRVEDECKQLREAVFAQTQFIRGLRSVFSTPLALSAVDLSHFLHNYTRLPRDQTTRWNEYAALAQDARLQSAVDILCRETRAMALTDAAEANDVRPSVGKPFIRTEVLQHAAQGGFGVTSTSVFALETEDLSAALRGVDVAARDIMARSQCYECTSHKRQILDPGVLSGSSSYANILIRLAPDDTEPKQARELSIESRVVTLSKQTDDHAVLLWDFVDDDELHPKKETTDITRQAVGACLVRREICDDGIERVVCRVMRTRRYRFHEHAPPEVLRRFESVVASMMRVSDTIFQGIVIDSIIKEQAAYAKAMAQLQAVEAA